MLLGDFGAEVTKIERPGVGDDTRTWGPPFDDLGEATYFESINRNKTSQVLDLNDPADLDEAKRLALEADVVIENFRPGLMAKLELDYESLKDRSPGLIYCSVTGFGGSGAGATMPGYDLLIQAVGGLMSVTGDPDGEPLKVGVALVDVICGVFTALGILAALEHRDRTGHGQCVEVDLLSSLLAAMVTEGATFNVLGKLPERSGAADPCYAPCESIRAGSRELVIAIATDEDFATLCELVGAPELAGDSRFSSNEMRVKHREGLRVQLEDRLARRSASDWVELFRRHRLAAGLVSTLAEAFPTAEDLDLEPTVSISRPIGAALDLTRNPVVLSRTPATYRLPPPPLPKT